MVFSLVFLVKVFLSSEGINQEIFQKISNDKEPNDFSRVIRQMRFWKSELTLKISLRRYMYKISGFVGQLRTIPVISMLTRKVVGIFRGVYYYDRLLSKITLLRI